MLTKSKKKQNNQVDLMIEAIDKLLDDIFKTAVKISKEWGDQNVIAVVTINKCISIAINNTEKMKGKFIVELRTSLIEMLGGFKNLIKTKALEMGTRHIPKNVLAEYILAVKNEVRKGAKKPILAPFKTDLL